jgi:carboxypeptidase Taq
MNPQDAYLELLRRMQEIELLNTTAGVLGWDQETGMPPANAEHRGNQLSLLSGLVHDRFTSPEIGDLLEKASQNPEVRSDPGNDIAVNLREWRRDYDRSRKLPKDLVEAFAHVSAEAQAAWAEARSKKNFSIFQPHLEKVVSLSRRQADCLGWTAHPYDALLEEYEPGLTTAELDKLFPPIFERLSSLVQKIAASNHSPDVSVLHRRFPIESQKQFCRHLAVSIGFDFSRGRLDVSDHPFTTGLGPGDTRITSRYDETDFSNSVFSVLHEAGHGLYEQGLPFGRLTGTPRSSAVSLGIHESQSRLWENLVGRNPGFWAYFYPDLQKAAPGVFQDVPLKDFFFAVNQSRPSLIRTEADEVTYNLHIGLRMQLEKDLLTGTLLCADVPAAWNAAMKKYLGLTPPDDALGCLQDVHWSHGTLGYFPTYTLGNLYAAQFFEAARRDLGDLEAMFTRGDFKPLKDWLNKKIHQNGKRYRAGELCLQVTGKTLSAEPYLTYLEDKFGRLYGLKESF